MSLSKRFVQMVNATIKAVDPSSAIGIAQGQTFSHDSVYRMLCEGKHCFTIFALNRLQSIKGLKGGYLVLDDSFLIRFSSGKLNLLDHKTHLRAWSLKKMKDSSTGQFAYGFNIVLLIWTNGTIRIPIGYRVFLAQPGETSKIEFALEMLEQAKELGIQSKFVL
jgi:hypothetical protein